ncbi:MAG: hypothetical protein OEY64_03625 [Nitrospinota bacterium]|nr:hypothetical protein [Nitrospinota bacterium]
MGIKERESGNVKCIRCGCTDEQACINDVGETCEWEIVNSDAGLGICTFCVDEDDSGDLSRTEEIEPGWEQRPSGLIVPANHFPELSI